MSTLSLSHVGYVCEIWEDTLSYHLEKCQTLAHLQDSFGVEEFFSLFFLMVNTTG